LWSVFNNRSIIYSQRYTSFYILICVDFTLRVIDNQQRMSEPRFIYRSAKPECLCSMTCVYRGMKETINWMMLESIKEEHYLLKEDFCKAAQEFLLMYFNIKSKYKMKYRTY